MQITSSLKLEFYFQPNNYTLLSLSLSHVQFPYDFSMSRKRKPMIYDLSGPFSNRLNYKFRLTTEALKLYSETWMEFLS